MWCPKCRCEYVEGITECPDCHVELVESLDDIDAEENTGDEEGRADTESPDNADSGADAENAGADQAAAENMPVKYRTLDEKAADLKSSGYTLLSVGIAGIIVIILMAAGVFPVNMTGIMKYISYSVMGLLFAIFIISGWRAMIRSKKVSEDAVRENDQRDEIMNWFVDGYDGETIDKLVNPDTDDNDLYFDRTEFMKAKISERFMDLDDGFMADIIERLYSELFEE